MNSFDLGRLERICSLLYESTLLPVSFIAADDNQVLCSKPETLPVNPAVGSIHRQWESWTNRDAPMLHVTAYLEHFAWIPVNTERFPTGWIVIGPAVSRVWPDHMLTGLLRDHKIPTKQYPAWLDYYRSMPSATNSQMKHAGILLYEWFTGESIDVSVFNELDPSVENGLAPAVLASLQLTDRREAGFFHHDPATEKVIFRHIRSGNKQALLEAQAALKGEQVGILSKRSPLRHQKNLSVSAITLATRAAIEGGVFPEAAYTLSDLHIQHIEELGEVSLVEKALLAALADFADKVRSSREQHVSRTIAACQNYIFDHLLEVLSLPRLAEAAGISPVHLSRLFHKETGVTLTDYIQKQRVEAAKDLLSLSTHTVSEISNRLLFHDQSYFIKIFKKHTGMTPNQFRLRGVNE